MVGRYDLRDERGRITGYVLRETPNHATVFRSGSRARQPDSPIAVAVRLALGAVTLAATLAYLWAATAG